MSAFKDRLFFRIVFVINGIFYQNTAQAGDL